MVQFRVIRSEMWKRGRGNTRHWLRKCATRGNNKALTNSFLVIGSPLGTLTVSQQKLDLENKLTVIQRHIWPVAGTLVQSLHSKQARPQAMGERSKQGIPIKNE